MSEKGPACEMCQDDGEDCSWCSLTACQRRGLEALQSGKNVFLTGFAGTGKSYLIQHWLSSLKKPAGITASTGVAALLIGGRTVHSFFGVGKGDDSLVDLIKNRKNGRNRATEAVRAIKVLLIDEISMISASLFTKLEAVARYDRESDEPWGGLQIVVVGDMGQMPPVNDSFCFLTETWKKSKFKPVMLRTQVRSEDEVFSRILAKIRDCDLDEEVLSFLDSRYNPVPDSTWVRVLPKNRDVDVWNRKKLYELEAPPRTFKAVGWGNEKLVQALMSSLPVPAELVLAEGAYVMFRVNDRNRVYANGTTGYIERILDDQLIINLADHNGVRSGRTIAVPRHSWSYPSSNPHEGPLASCMQFPVQLAWAVTTHKTQGATLNHAAVDLTGMWEAGQAYVALSRVRKPEDVVILGWDERSFMSNPNVVALYKLLEKVG